MHNEILSYAQSIQDDLVKIRRDLHRNPEIGMELYNTVNYVKAELSNIGCNFEEIDKNCLVVTFGKSGKTILIRGDMDALPLKEETSEDFKSVNENMHACGHDLHTSMLIGTAKILKRFEHKLKGTVKLMFQPGEETLEGAKKMIEAGVLENPTVDAAITLHVVTGMKVPTGTFILPTKGPCTSGCDWFDITIKGKGGHGAMPEDTIDPLNVANQIYIALQSITAREITPLQPFVLTVGEMHAGTSPNIIPNTASLKGTIRTFCEETRAYVKKRIVDISTLIAQSLRAEADVKIIDGCPSIINNDDIHDFVWETLITQFGEEGVVPMSQIMEGGRIMASEDFAFVIEKTKGLIYNLAVGHPNEGHIYPQHHPRATFSEEPLYKGALAHAIIAMEYLSQLNK